MPFGRTAVRVLVAALLGSYAASGCASADLTRAPEIQPVATVVVSPSPVSVAVGATTTLSAILHDQEERVLSGRSITWASSDETRATVNQGVVSGVSPGAVTITATSEGKQGSATVIVTASGGGPGGSGVLAVTISSYMGGSAFDHSRDVAVDAAGNVYVVGGTMSPNFPTTAGAFQRIHNPGSPSQAGISPMDAFVVKLSPAGQVIWSTLLGGPNYDRAYAVEVDAQGNVFVAGRAGAGFPVTAGAFQPAFQGGQEATFYGPQDGFVCKLDASGSAVRYCSYFGTGDPQAVRDIAIDGAGNAYLAASAGQNGLPSAWFANAFQKTRAGGVDGVVAKINQAGTQVLWATYLGGSGNEGNGENSIRLDAGGNVYFLQNTASGGLPTPGGFDHALGGTRDLYLARLSPDGAALQYATYIGGSGTEFGETHNLALDDAGNAYVAGTTSSTDFPTTAGAFQTTFGGGGGGGGSGSGGNYPGDGGIVKISPAGTLLAGTYLGGRYGEGVEGVAVDGQGNVYVSGGTFSDNFPATTARFLNRGGGLDAFAVRLAASFASLLFAQQIGGSGDDVARSATIDATGSMYIVGEIGSGNFPVLAALQSNFGGVADALVVKLARTD